MSKWIAFSLIMLLAIACLAGGLVFLVPEPHTTQWNIIGAFYIAIGIIALAFSAVVVRMKD